ncbi:MAG: hypothetical protein JSU05_11030 [Bacteroidetes bacterium]|nr:hypothetical protein [Bacteroidota bacterium]
MKGRKKREDGRENIEVKDKIASKISQLILKMQSRFANVMNKITKDMSASSMKWSLILFIVAGSALSIYCIVSAFLKRDKKQAVTIDRIHVPQYYDKNGDDLLPQDFLISKKEYEELLAFQSYMDSLHQSKSGQRIYDSIMLCRPGLSDSINQLEKLYQQQLQNKK